MTYLMQRWQDTQVQDTQKKIKGKRQKRRKREWKNLLVK